MNIFINNQEQRLRAGWRLLVQFILMFLITGFFQLGIMLVWKSSLSLEQTIPLFIGILTSVWIAARFFDGRSLVDYGLEFDRRWEKEFLIGTGIGLFAMGAIFLVEWLAGWLTVSGFGWQESTNFGWKLAAAFVAMLMVGFHEELLSRGYQILNITEGLRYPQLGSRWPVIIAILATSLLFGCLHLANPNASAVSTFNIVLAGIALAIPYALTGSLAFSVGLHFSWNFMQGGICGFPVSGMKFQTSILRISQAGTKLWTGGKFGPEAGLMGIMGIAIMILLSCVYIMATRGQLGIAERFKTDYQPKVKSDEHKL
ncbi:MAG TPA: type II CAAX endopeptidase family protein [Balneolaceae bacterium]|nr:type II CAAX endopeptidase family protein [Balneolaceae bacterium]